ncbi:MAG: hypothetical protein J5544_02320, partial [Clostridia bacterium]|nr:hypothetical protein [Clostridia bacterium]
MDKAQIKGYIAARVAKELKDGDVVNLGIGLPTLVPAYLPEDVHVILQSENGTIGVGPVTPENKDPYHVVDAGGFPSAAAPGACFIDSASSFALIVKDLPAASSHRLVSCSTSVPCSIRSICRLDSFSIALFIAL